MIRHRSKIGDHALVSIFVSTVDAFTDQPFSGNPAAVCVLDGPADETWMQQVAMEMNLSETAFVYPDGDLWNLRWFTPTVEVDLCGHATLAATHVLATQFDQTGTIRYTTRSGILAAQALDDVIILDFPADPSRRADAPQGLLAALGVPEGTPVRQGRSNYLIAIETEKEVRNLTPVFNLLRRVTTNGVIVTAPADADRVYDVASRFFHPGIGIDEDPVTGAAHCTLSSYWSARLERDRLRYVQVSARGGELEVARVGERVEITGQAVTTMRGEILV
ncbi:MAG: PhzF family phenazine biosynthesis protein [Candidatus Aldehydirespiratoraceae bacterium]|jgi:PhzF family phenazine biosynthesis protein